MVDLHFTGIKVDAVGQYRPYLNFELHPHPSLVLGWVRLTDLKNVCDTFIVQLKLGYPFVFIYKGKLIVK